MRRCGGRQAGGWDGEMGGEAVGGVVRPGNRMWLTKEREVAG